MKAIFLLWVRTAITPIDERRLLYVAVATYYSRDKIVAVTPQLLTV